MTQSIGQCRLKLSRGNGYSKGQADHIARAMCLRGKQVEAYLCDHCGLWHVGRRFKKTPKRGERVADDDICEKHGYSLPTGCQGCVIDKLKVERDKLAAFKAWVHAWLDEHGVPRQFPGGPHTAEGCRIGDRMHWLRTEMDKLAGRVQQLHQAEQATAKQRDEARASLESYREHCERVMSAAKLQVADGHGDQGAMAAAWAAVWRELWDAGMGSFLDSLSDNGLQRATKFVRHLKAERDRLRQEIDRLTAKGGPA